MQSPLLKRYCSRAATESSQYNTVVVGSGLAGLTTALKLSEKGFSVALIEKTASLGGNSIKASSGINGVPTKYQDSQAGDSVAAFTDDTLVSGKGLCDERLVEIMAQDSAHAISWLADEVKVDLSAVAQLGGHSFARTHRGKGKLPPGFAIISALTETLKKQPNVVIMTRTRVQGFSKIGQHVTGVVVDQENEDGTSQKGKRITSDHVVLATGGFSADTTSKDSLIKAFRPDLITLPLTNGQQTTGDGHRLASLGLDARLVQMDQIQVHPTGFIQMKSDETKTSKWKFLCGELMRGIGGILLCSATGKRFVNELSTRDEVTSKMREHGGSTSVAIIVVGAQDYAKAASHIDFYCSQLLMFKGGAKDMWSMLSEVAPDSMCTLNDIQQALAEYNASVGTKHDSLGRSHFGNAMGDTVYFGFVTPVLHFTMGGVETNEHRQILRKNGTAIGNVYAVGELSAGVHGANRLAGSSLLECVVFGTRVEQHISGRSGESGESGE